MISAFYKYYWDFGFRSGLYDALTPEAYRQSMREMVASIPLAPNRVLLDAGCGSGALLNVLAYRLGERGRYLGVDRLIPGLQAASRRFESIPLPIPGGFIRADLSQTLPLKSRSVDVVCAHFSLYTLADDTARQSALKEFRRVLHPGGFLAVANPSENYSASQIIEHSLESIKRGGIGNSAIYKYFIYALTRVLGLNFIQKQLESGIWKAYAKGECAEEIRSAGFKVRTEASVYADSGWLVTAVK